MMRLPNLPSAASTYPLPLLLDLLQVLFVDHILFGVTAVHTGIFVHLTYAFEYFD
jgi:hypothetical protein